MSIGIDRGPFNVASILTDVGKSIDAGGQVLWTYDPTGAQRDFDIGDVDGLSWCEKRRR